MTIPTWGLLQKSQADNETIEEAIARLIAVHEADETSHLEVGESLQSHKASEIIDHLAESIVADKIANNQISPFKFSFKNVTSIQGVQSIDCFGIFTSGAPVAVTLPNYNQIMLYIDTTIGHYASVALSVQSKYAFDDEDPTFECNLDNAVGPGLVSRLAVGDNRPLDHDYGCLGFEFDWPNNKTYVFVRYGESSPYTEDKIEIVGGVIASGYFRIEVDNANNEIRFYIDDDLVHTYDKTDKQVLFEVSDLFSYEVKRVSAGAALYCFFENIFFVKNNLEHFF